MVSQAAAWRKAEMNLHLHKRKRNCNIPSYHRLVGPVLCLAALGTDVIAVL